MCFLATALRRVTQRTPSTCFCLTVTRPNGTVAPLLNVLHPEVGEYVSDVALDTVGMWTVLSAGAGTYVDEHGAVRPFADTGRVRFRVDPA